MARMTAEDLRRNMVKGAGGGMVNPNRPDMSKYSAPSLGLIGNPGDLGFFDLLKQTALQSSGLLPAYQKQQQDIASKQQVRDLIGSMRANVDQGQRGLVEEVDPVTGETYTYEKSILPTTAVGSEALATDPANMAQLYSEMLTTPGYEQIGAQGMQGLIGSSSGQKPTSLMQNFNRLQELRLTDPEKAAEFEKLIMKPSTQISMGTKAVPVADLMKMRLPDGSRPPPGTTWDQLQAMGATLQKELAGDTGSKLAMLDTAKQGVRTIEPILFGKDGKINRDIIKQAWGIGVAEPVAGLVSPEAGQVFAGFEYGIQAITRSETGAAMPSTEIDNTRKRFMPKPWDSDEVVKQKWTAYNLFINNASKYINPKAKKSGDWGKLINFDALMNDAKTNTGSGLIGGGQQPKSIRFEDL